MKIDVKIILVIILVMVTSVACSGVNNQEAQKLSQEKGDNNQVQDLNKENIDLSGFVQVENGEFLIDGQAFRFMGTNNYYLNYKDEAMIDDLIENAKDMGVKVIRVWGFLDGMGDSMVNNNTFMQTQAGVYGQIPKGARNGFEALDYAVKRAGQEGIYLVIALTNNWDAFGGVNQYVEWSDTASSHDDFYTDEACKTMYKNYVKHMISRKNSITGTPYMEDPTIMTWELMNEPRVDSDPSGDVLYQWAEEMSAYVKSIDPNHLVALGDEGFFKREGQESWAYNGWSGVDWERNLTIDTIDYGTFHLYPEHWGDDFDNPIKSGVKWIEDHAKTGQKIGKPVVLEEYGIQRGIIHNRDYIYTQWLETAYSSGINGTQFWMLAAKDTGDSADEEGLYPDYDGFRVINNGGVTAEILQEDAKLMADNKAEMTFKDRTFILHPRSGEKVSGIYAFKADSLIYSDVNVESYSLMIEGLEPVELPSIGVYVFDTAKEPINGLKTVTMQAKLSDGSTISDQVLVNFDNKEKVEVVKKQFTFDKDLEGFVSEGTYMADFGQIPLEHSDFNGGALALNISLSGDKEWQELRIVNRNVGNLADIIRLEYDIYYKEALIFGEGEWKPYAVANPGWTKLGLEMNNQLSSNLESVEVNGETYLKHHVSIEVTGIFDAPELFIGVVGSYVGYDGPVYIDDIVLIGEEVVE